MNDQVIIAVDVGGSKIATAIVQGGQCIDPVGRVDTPQDFDVIIDTIARQIDHMLHTHGYAGRNDIPLGLCLPGYVDPDTGPRVIANIPDLAGRNVRAALMERMQCPVRLINDAQAFLLGAVKSQGLIDQSPVFGMILGTGVGGALMVNRQIMNGRHGFAGEWGQIRWPDGHGGTLRIDEWLGAGALARMATEMTGQPQTTRVIIDAMNMATSWALDVRAAYLARLRDLMQLVIMMYDPAVIVIGGGLTAIPDLVPLLDARLSQIVPISPCLTRIVQAPDAGHLSLLGAAALWS